MLDIVQRYQPIVRHIKKHPPKNKRVLEVGGGGDGLGYYLTDYKIFDCDLSHADSTPGNTKKLVIKNEKLPFAKKYFYSTACVDTLEHIQDKRARLRLLREIERVTSKFIYIAVPTGEKSFVAHQKLKRHLMRFYPKRENKYLNEHLALGHPEKEDILELLKQVAPQAKIVVKDNANITLWLWFQKIYLALPRLYHFLKHRNLWRKIMGPVWFITNRPPTIRTLFILNLKPAEESYL